MTLHCISNDYLLEDLLMTVTLTIFGAITKTLTHVSLLNILMIMFVPFLYSNFFLDGVD
jgi:hypothetical protein